ncbi:tetratricopeptide repeat protein [Sphingomonas sp. PP-CC-3G-468]|nr:tetratricopeptide repeat protein [Sphingomonas sp. PP-CC-3G-468]
MAWRALARALRNQGKRVPASAAFARSITASFSDPELTMIEKLIQSGNLAEAIRLLDGRLASDNDDVIALRQAGDIAARSGRAVDAERYYRRCIDFCPSYMPARHGLSRLLLRQARLAEASNETERMLAVAPTDPIVRTLKAAVAASVGNHADAGALYEGLTAELPGQAAFWLGLGHSHRTVGRTSKAVSAYRRALDIPAGAAEACWSLSNLKTYQFDDADVDRMIRLASEADGMGMAYLHFALGQAFDRRGDAERAFDHFARGNAAKRETISYDADSAEERMLHWTTSVSAETVGVRGGEGDPSSAPIFIVGLPRSGSTLVEQILGSHSLIESTAELPYMDKIASRLARRGTAPGQERTGLDVDGVDLALLGREYLSASRAHRKTAKPFFIDKLPGNFAHAALIKLILPNARIIDVRRHPLATAWSVFKQLFAHGQPFAYDLTEIARWYRSYAVAMTHFDTVLPGGIFHLRYEHLVNEPEVQVRRLLEHLRLAFEPACLRHYENGNAVRTPSSEQVRQPIFRHGLDDWRRYGLHLQPAVETLEA